LLATSLWLGAKGADLIESNKLEARSWKLKS
jgi:hypothetical protein